MYADGKILVVGGGDPPTNTAEVIDLNQPSPTWRAVAPMSIARRQLNATLLPDGNVLVTGGTSGPGFNNAATPVYPAEVWDPATETWTTLASATVPRLYHSAATLLPDGRVLSTGGNGQPTPEAFSPPYLFKGPVRRCVRCRPPSATASSFSVQSPEAANITKVTLIRIASVTHAFDQNQRLSVLSFTPGPARSTSWRRRPPTSRRRDTTCSSSSTATELHPSGASCNSSPARPCPRPATLTRSRRAARRRAAPAFTLTVNGTGFVIGATVRWNGAARTTTFVGSTQLTAAIPASDIAAAGTGQVTVVNPGAVASNALPFTVTAAAPPATLTALSPSSAAAGGPGVHAHRERQGFVNRGERPVEWRGPDDDIRQQRSADRRDSRERHRRGRHELRSRW